MIASIKRLPIGFLVLLILTFLIILLAAALLVFEQENAQSAVNSFSQSLWFCAVNLFFGKNSEIVPISSGGRVIGLIIVAVNRLLYVFIVAYAIVHFRKRRSVSQ